MKKFKDMNENWIDISKMIPVTKTGHISEKFEGLTYGDDELQKLDIYLPEKGTKPFPVIINVHGGGMFSGDKHDFHLYPTLFALEKGFAVVAINYRLSPAVKYPTQVYDVKSAILWLANNGAEYGIDINNIFLWGTSAGGNLVLMSAVKKGMELPEDLKQADSIPIRAVAALCPGIDMNNYGRCGKWSDRLYMRILCFRQFTKVLGIKKPTQEDFKKTNPTTYLHNGIAPLYLQHGDKDFAVPISQTYDFGKKAQEILGENDLVIDILPGASHAGNGPDFLMKENVLPILEFFTKYIED